MDWPLCTGSVHKGTVIKPQQCIFTNQLANIHFSLVTDGYERSLAGF